MENRISVILVPYSLLWKNERNLSSDVSLKPILVQAKMKMFKFNPFPTAYYILTTYPPPPAEPSAVVQCRSTVPHVCIPFQNVFITNLLSCDLGPQHLRYSSFQQPSRHDHKHSQ